MGDNARHHALVFSAHFKRPALAMDSLVGDDVGWEFPLLPCESAFMYCFKKTKVLRKFAKMHYPRFMLTGLVVS